MLRGSKMESAPLFRTGLIGLILFVFVCVLKSFIELTSSRDVHVSDIPFSYIFIFNLIKSFLCDSSAPSNLTRLPTYSSLTGLVTFTSPLNCLFVQQGHFRRGEALILQKDWQAAKDAFDAVLALEPGNKAAKNKSVTCVHKMKEQKSKEKQTCQRIFNTIWAEQEAEEKENEKRKAEMKKAKAAKKAAAAAAAVAAGDKESEEEDPAANDALGHEEVADIPVLSQS